MHTVLVCNRHSPPTLTSYLVLQKGRTALYWASWYGKLSVVQTLLEYGANLDVQTNVSILVQGLFRDVY